MQKRFRRFWKDLQQMFRINWDILEYLDEIGISWNICNKCLKEIRIFLEYLQQIYGRYWHFWKDLLQMFGKKWDILQQIFRRHSHFLDNICNKCLEQIDIFGNILQQIIGKIGIDENICNIKCAYLHCVVPK